MFGNSCTTYCCFLSDELGNAVCPYEPGNIVYTELTSSGNSAQTSLPPTNYCTNRKTQTIISINGYVTLAAKTGNYKKTLPFNTSIAIDMPAEPRSNIAFITKYFKCSLQPQNTCANTSCGQNHIAIQVQACACAKTCCSCADCIDICGNRNCCIACAVFQACTAVEFNKSAMQAEVYQYNAIAQNEQKVFTNDDELTEYGSMGIPCPNDFSLNKVFVNGFLQPPVNYNLQKGELRFKTKTLPSAGEVVSVHSMRLKGGESPLHAVDASYYVAISDGIKTTYTDADALTEYGNDGIPSPCEVSFFNLYVNGVLQPAPVYNIKKGILELTEAPASGQYVLLESIAVRANAY